MNQDNRQAVRALRLPADVVQPFSLSFAPDDLHVMAFFTGHPEYEAVEAMIRQREDRAPLVRAILTRHDQSQVDHSNDDRPQAVDADEREKVYRNITCAMVDAVSSRRVILGFRSFRDEAVELDITSHGLPDEERGGLSDPGGHSSKSSLPVMYRRRSTLAASCSQVTIDGEQFPIPTRIALGGHSIAMEGYFSELHHMAALRSGFKVLELLDRPDRFKVGECWVYRSDGALLTYRIARTCASGAIEVTRSDARTESIRGMLVDGRIELAEVQARHRDDAQHFVALTFSPGSFALAINGGAGLLSGTVQTSDADGAETSIRLTPQLPPWAINRPVQISIVNANPNQISIRTTVGLPPPAPPNSG